MKGFPNQVAELSKLAVAMQTLMRLVNEGAGTRSDAVFGEALVRAGVAGTGHIPVPIEEYLTEQRLKEPSSRSFQTTARGLRELFRLFNFIDDAGPIISVTASGREAAAFAGRELDSAQIEFWRRAVRSLAHQGSDETVSHPYQVLLRLVGRVPGITRAKCALALEARDDSPAELNRIVRLSALDEGEIIPRLDITKSNWNNAKKVLPRFAEQLGDVIKKGHTYVLADAPGQAGSTQESGDREQIARRAVPRAPRSSRNVTPASIATAGVAERTEGPLVSPELDLQRVTAAGQLRFDRLRRHNGIVRRLAKLLSAAGARLYEDPFDVLAVFEHVGVLAEIKSLDGTVEDERDRVQECLSQLLYYEAFVTPPDARGVAIHKIACFERQISEAHSR